MAYKDDTSNQLKLPERYSRRKINALYREIPLSDSTFRTLRKYFSAMANLYGVIPVKKAHEIISEQSPSLVTSDEFAAFAEVARHETECYYILGRDELFAGERAGTIWDCEIIDVTLINQYDSLDFYAKIRDSQRYKPYYIPQKTHLLKYSDPVYIEETPELATMRDFLGLRMKLPPDSMGSALNKIAFNIRYMEDGPELLGDAFKELDITFSCKADFDSFVELYNKLRNAARMQCNRGYSPNELIRMQPQKCVTPKPSHIKQPSKSSDLYAGTDAGKMLSILAAIDEMDDSIKFNMLKLMAERNSSATQQNRRVGRNDPCPCGSGKKYKNCCGL